MQFQVPQFIEVEDKIIGPFTLKQFLYLGGGLGASVAIFIYIPYKIISVLLIIPIIAFSLALTFYKINGKPFIDTAEASVYYYLANKLYLWKKEQKKPETKLESQIQSTKSMISVPKMSESRLKDLTWSLDIKESLNPVTKEDNK